MGVATVTLVVVGLDDVAGTSPVAGAILQPVNLKSVNEPLADLLPKSSRSKWHRPCRGCEILSTTKAPQVA